MGDNLVGGLVGLGDEVQVLGPGGSAVVGVHAFEQAVTDGGVAVGRFLIDQLEVLVGVVEGGVAVGQVPLPVSAGRGSPVMVLPFDRSDESGR